MTTVESSPAPLSNASATAFLSSLLDRRLRVSITDGRIFVGQLKCTDRERNLVLAAAYEHRPPAPHDIQRAAAASATAPSLKLDMERRYVGLVVVPGEHITQITLD